ncbi:aldo/keto reductase [Microbacterium excoecariae]|uniref:aldo/keto reductase n=1 Tax=Microbacterium excoecariae TaxID=2715210 RepID=UPI001407F304|nr:aldo/keto reductase [Microbacterium excoecariae]NHI16441.1 aldo/keto reductase [Microbacterium excoecariae]
MTLQDDDTPALAQATRRAPAAGALAPSAEALAPHPSAPLPEVGPPLGAGVRRALGRTGIDVFPLVLGTAGFQTLPDPREATALLDRYAQAGGNAIQVAEAEGDPAPDLVGGWIRGRGLDGELVVAARVSAAVGAANDADRILQAVERVIARLTVSRIDVLVLDLSRSVPGPAALEETLAVAERILQAGLARSIGARGLAGPGLIEARVLASAGYPRIDVVDVAYGLGARAPFEETVAPIALPQKVAAVTSLAVPRGLLEAPARARGVRRVVGGRSRLRRALDAAAVEAGTTAAGVALAWALAQPGVAAAAVDVVVPRHVDELAAALAVDLNRAQVSRLDRAAAR